MMSSGSTARAGVKVGTGGAAGRAIGPARIHGGDGVARTGTGVPAMFAVCLGGRILH